MKNKEKGKVGRPKLADKKLKYESMFISIFILVVIFIVAIIGYKILTIDSNPKYLVGTIYNNHINSCILKDNKIDCGPNVSYVKYYINDELKGEIEKENDSIEIDLEEYKNIKVCYKTNSDKLICKKL